MNNRGYIFDLLKLENGWIITLLLIFRFGWIKGDDGFGPYKCIQFGIGKLEFTFSLAWKNNMKISIDNIEGYS